MMFGINTTLDISELSQITYNDSWYLCQISLKIMLLTIQIKLEKLRPSLSPLCLLPNSAF